MEECRLLCEERHWEMWINTLSRTGMIVTSGNHLNGGSWD